MDADSTTRIDALSALSDPIRRALFDFVARRESPVSRQDAADALEIPRSTAAFHLDRLVEGGALRVEFKRLSGRTGPGAGRPAKLYRLASDELAVSIPKRQYELAGDLLASAVEESARTGAPVREALGEVAAETGRRIGNSVGTLETALDQCGYEPEEDEEGVLLTNCPFHRLAARHTEVICHTNLRLLQGVAEGAGDDEHEVVFAPGPGHCCVRLDRRDASDT